MAVLFKRNNSIGGWGTCTAICSIYHVYFFTIANAHSVAMATTETTQSKTLSEIILWRIVHFTPRQQQKQSVGKDHGAVLKSSKDFKYSQKIVSPDCWMRGEIHITLNLLGIIFRDFDWMEACKTRRQVKGKD